MLTLNLPTFDHKLSQKNGDLYIFDAIRKIELKLTPEEWVRQHYLNYLTQHLKYPKSLINSEIGMNYYKRSKRVDIVVYSPADGNPLILIECKAPFVKISPRTLQQATVYAYKLKPHYMVLTNGIMHQHFKIKDEFLLLDQLPGYEDLIF